MSCARQRYPVKVFKENGNFFAEQIILQFNEGVYSSKYVSLSKKPI